MLREPSTRWLPQASVVAALTLVILLLGGTGLVLANDGPRPHALPDEPPPIKAVAQEPIPYYASDVEAQPAQATQLVLNVNYRHDWVEGLYPLDHTIWLTVTDDMGNMKASIELETQQLTHWQPTQPNGFSSQLGGSWQPVPPDIVPGDWVYASSDEGLMAETQIGAITGDLDVAADTLEITVNASWLSGSVGAYCVNWATGVQLDFMINPNGGTHLCDFGADGDDLTPGQNIAAAYIEPDLDRVINVFIDPVPDLRMEKWAPGSGLSMPGGPVVYALRYRNDGAQVANNITLADTLPAGTTYVEDSSGLTANQMGNTVTWNPPALDPGESNIFYMVLDSTAALGDVLTNQAEISVALDPIPDNNTATANVTVASGQPDLFVGTNPNPVDPVAGGTMLWYIDYGNNGPVASGNVVMTMTLPANTTVVEWWSEGLYNLWEEQAGPPDPLVLNVESIPGMWRDRITVRLALDAALAPDTQLVNSVEISTAQDSDPSNNDDSYLWSRVGQDRADISVNKTLNWGTFVPGGEVSYFLYVNNLGNVPSDVTLTDIIPVGTTFDSSWLVVLPSRQPLTPDNISASEVVWDLGTLLPGESIQIEVRIVVDITATPGGPVFNCAEVSIPGGDSRPTNDRSCHSQIVEDTGPNLQVEKDCWWDDTDVIQCQVSFRNLGTTILENLVFTDVLPEQTSFANDWWHYFWEDITLNYNATTNELVWEIAELQQAWSSQLNYRVAVDPAIAGDQGLVFENTVSAPVAGDVSPGDNQATGTAFTGPDLYATKRLSGGTVGPGERLTFTIEFGNRNVWPWGSDPNFNVRVIDTLPPGVTYVSSTTPTDPTVTGQQLVWQFPALPALTSQQFQVVVDLPAELPTGTLLVNQVEIEGLSPVDIEHNLANNVFNLPLSGEFFRLYLPMIFRNTMP